MPFFAWVPNPDAGLDTLAAHLSDNKKFEARVISRPGDDGVAANKARWGDIRADDHLLILGHGFRSDTATIGWGRDEETDTALVTWTYRQLADALNHNLAPKPGPLTFDLLMCWSADWKLGHAAFGGKLASALGREGFRGRVYGYKGMVMLTGMRASLFVKGSGRFTSRFGSAGMDYSKIREEDGVVTVGQRNYFEYSQKRVTWNIPTG